MLSKRGPYAYSFLAHFQTSYEDTFPLQTVLVPPGWVTGSPTLTPPNTRKEQESEGWKCKGKCHSAAVLPTV